MGVNRFGLGRRAEQLGDLGFPIGIGFLGKSQILTIRLTLARKRRLQIINCRHISSSPC
jgi:hypothetical protein